METEITILNDCSLDKVGHDYLRIIEDAVGTYLRTLSKLLISVRLMGSVARGEATFGSSDIDFVALTSMNPDIDQRNMFTSVSKQLTAKYSCVSRVDMEIEIKGRVSVFREFIFQTDSICLWGEDNYTKTDLKMSNVILSKLVTPDFNVLLSGYRQRIRNPIHDEELGQLCRAVCKDVLKCFRKYLILRRAVYRKSVLDIHNELITYYAEERVTFDRLLRIYEQPVERREDLVDILKSANESFRRIETRSA